MPQDSSITRFTRVEMASTTNPKGGLPTLRVPSLQTADFAKISEPKNGMIAYNQTSNTFQYYINGAWQTCAVSPLFPPVATLTTEQIEALEGMKEGAIVYDTDRHKLMVRTEETWEEITSAAPENSRKREEREDSSPSLADLLKERTQSHKPETDHGAL